MDRSEIDKRKAGTLENQLVPANVSLFRLLMPESPLHDPSELDLVMFILQLVLP